MKQIGTLAIAAALAMMVTGCGGGGNTTPSAVATATPTPAPTATPVPAPGPVTLSWTGTTLFTGTSGAASAMPIALAFQAPTQKATLTATEANFGGTFTAVVSAGCPQITIAAGAAAGTFVVTAADATVAACTITVTGATGQTATLSTTVPKPGGVSLRWYSPNFAVQANPQPFANTPINLVGLGSTFGVLLVASEANFVGTISAPTLSAGCTGNVTSAALAAAPASITGAVPGSVAFYYTVSAAAVPAAACTLTFVDNYVNLLGLTPAPVTIGVSVTTAGGTFQ